MTAASAGVEVGVVGLRTFRVEARTGGLLPISGGPHAIATVWRGGTCIATCRKRKSTHTTPAPECRCGIYSFPDLETLRNQYPTAASIVAVIALEGDVIEGTHGWRAQAARIVGLWVDPDTIDRDLAARIAAANPDAALYTDVDEMVATFGLRHTAAICTPLDPDTPRVSGPCMAAATLGQWWRRRAVVTGSVRTPWLRHVPSTVRWWVGTLALAYLLGSYAFLGGNHLRAEIGTSPHSKWSAFVDTSDALTRLAVLFGQQANTPLYGVLAVPLFVGITATLLQLMNVVLPGYGGRFAAASMWCARILRIPLRVIVACAITAALTHHPSALSVLQFWGGAAAWWMALNLPRAAAAEPIATRLLHISRDLCTIA